MTRAKTTAPLTSSRGRSMMKVSAKTAIERRPLAGAPARSSDSRTVRPDAVASNTELPSVTTSRARNALVRASKDGTLKSEKFMVTCSLMACRDKSATRPSRY